MQGYLGSTQAGVEARNDVTVAIRNWFANRNPLVTRLPYVPVERIDFLMYTHKYRARATTTNAAITAGGTTATLTLTDATFLMNHDVLELVDSATGNIERVQVSADPLTATTVTVLRGLWSAIGGTVGAAGTTVTTGSIVNLIGNARTGAEVNQTGLTTIGGARTQYCQTFQFPVQVGGSAQTARAQVLPGGIQSPFDFNQTVQLQNMVDDIENSCYVGIGQAPNDTTLTPAKMNGLRSIFQTNNISPYGNVAFGNAAAPVNAAAYGPMDLVRDLLQSARSNGGDPDVMFVATNWMTAFATWGHAIQRIPAGETVMGTPINVMKAPFLEDVTVIEAPLMKNYSAFALTSSEVYIRNKRNPYWNLRGNRGDMVEGDWLAEMAIEVVNESHHSWLEGVTAFSAN